MTEKTLTTMVFLALLMTVIPCNGQSKPTTKAIVVAFDNIPLGDALKEIGAKSGVSFTLSKGLRANKKRVTITKTSATVGEILTSILQPLNLVGISVKANEINIVPTTSRSGQFKYYGQAIRKAVMLARKLEKATFVNGRIHVPGWTEGDDNMAMRMVRDGSALSLYFDAGVGTSHEPESVNDEKNLTCFDDDVRIGTALAFERHGRDLSPDQMKQIAEDPNPIVRATWYIFYKRLLRQESLFNQAIKDDDPLIRLAVLIRRDHQAAKLLKNDPNETVRFCANLSVLERMKSSNIKEIGTLLDTMFEIRNPIMKMAIVSAALMKTRADAHIVMNLERRTGDPLLKHVATYLKWQAMDDPAELAAFVDDRINSLESPVLSERLFSLWSMGMILGTRHKVGTKTLYMKIMQPDSNAWAILGTWIDDKNLWFKAAPLVVGPFESKLKEILPSKIMADLKENYLNALSSENEHKKQTALVLGLVGSATGATSSNTIKTAYSQAFSSPSLTDQIIGGFVVGGASLFEVAESLKIIADLKDNRVATRIACDKLASRAPYITGGALMEYMGQPIPQLHMALAENINRLGTKADIFYSKATYLPALLKAVKGQRHGEPKWKSLIPVLKRALENADSKGYALIAGIMAEAMYKANGRDLKKGEIKDLDSIYQTLFSHAEKVPSCRWGDNLCYNLLNVNLHGKEGGASKTPSFLGAHPGHMRGKAKERILDIMADSNNPERGDLAIKALTSIARHNFTKETSYKYSSRKDPLDKSIRKEYARQLTFVLSKGKPNQKAPLLSALAKRKGAEGEKFARRLEYLLLSGDVPITIDMLSSLGTGRVPGLALKNKVLSAPVSRKERLYLLSQVEAWANTTVKFILANPGNRKAAALELLNLDRQTVDDHGGFWWWGMLSKTNQAKVARALLALAEDESAMYLIARLQHGGVYGGVKLIPYFEKYAHPKSPIAMTTLNLLFDMNPKSTIYTKYLKHYDSLSSELKGWAFQKAIAKPEAKGTRDYILKVLDEQKNNSDFWSINYYCWGHFKFPEDPELHKALKKLKDQKSVRVVYKLWKKQAEERSALLRFDIDGDGTVDDDEKRQAAEAILERMESKGLKGKWKSYDKDGNGILEKAERKAAIKELVKKLK